MNLPADKILPVTPKVMLTALLWSYTDMDREEKILRNSKCVLPGKVEQGDILPRFHFHTVNMCLPCLFMCQSPCFLIFVFFLGSFTV